MKVRFAGSVDVDDAANAFILAFIASRKGKGVSGEQIWKSLRSRGVVPSDGNRTSGDHPDDGAAIAEIQFRLNHLVEEGVVGGEAEPESITGQRFYWSIGQVAR